MRLFLWAVVLVSSIMHCATEFDIVKQEGLGVCSSWTAGCAWEDSSIGEVFAHAGEQTPLAPNVLTVPCTVPVGDARQAGTSSDLDTYAYIVVATPPGEVPVLRRDNAAKQAGRGGRTRKSCERCFQKRTPCDESNPCSRCSLESVECIRPNMDTNLAVLMAINAVAVATHPVMAAAAPIPDNTTEFDRTLHLQELEDRRTGKCCVAFQFLSKSSCLNSFTY